MGGPDMAPQTPHRSSRPGGAVARLDHTPIARRAPAEPWRASAIPPIARRAPAEPWRASAIPPIARRARRSRGAPRFPPRFSAFPLPGTFIEEDVEGRERGAGLAREAWIVGVE